MGIGREEGEGAVDGADIELGYAQPDKGIAVRGMGRPKRGRLNWRQQETRRGRSRAITVRE